MHRIKNKNVLLTGATGGIGRQIALTLGRAGASLMLAARSADQLEALQAELRSTGARADFAAGDLLDDSQVNFEPQAVDREVTLALDLRTGRELWTLPEPMRPKPIAPAETLVLRDGVALFTRSSLVRAVSMAVFPPPTTMTAPIVC